MVWIDINLMNCKIITTCLLLGTLSVTVIIIGNEGRDLSSNLGQSCISFHAPRKDMILFVFPLDMAKLLGRLFILL